MSAEDFQSWTPRPKPRAESGPDGAKKARGLYIAAFLGYCQVTPMVFFREMRASSVVADRRPIGLAGDGCMLLRQLHESYWTRMLAVKGSCQCRDR